MCINAVHTVRNICTQSVGSQSSVSGQSIVSQWAVSGQSTVNGAAVNGQSVGSQRLMEQSMGQSAHCEVISLCCHGQPKARSANGQRTVSATVEQSVQPSNSQCDSERTSSKQSAGSQCNSQWTIGPHSVIQGAGRTLIVKPEDGPLPRAKTTWSQDYLQPTLLGAKTT